MTDPTHTIRSRDVHTPDFTKHAAPSRPPSTIGQNIYESLSVDEISKPKIEPMIQRRDERFNARIYVASKVIHAPQWRAIRAAGVNVVSTWIDEAGEGETKDYGEVWVRIRNEIRSSEALIIMIKEGEDHSGGTLVEVGMALALDKRVVLVGTPKKGTWPNHPAIVRATSLSHALEVCGVYDPSPIALGR